MLGRQCLVGQSLTSPPIQNALLVDARIGMLIQVLVLLLGSRFCSGVGVVAGGDWAGWSGAAISGKAAAPNIFSRKVKLCWHHRFSTTAAAFGAVGTSVLLARLGKLCGVQFKLRLSLPNPTDLLVSGCQCPHEGACQGGILTRPITPIYVPCVADGPSLRGWGLGGYCYPFQ